MTTNNLARRAGTRPTRYATLCLLALIAVLCRAHEARAQWSPNDSTGSTETTGAGRVGIGTTPSKGKLHVALDEGVTAGEHGIIYASKPNQTGGVYMGYRANGTAVTGGYLRSTALLPLFVGTNSTPEAMTITDNGRVGIGTSDPTHNNAVGSRFTVAAADDTGTAFATSNGTTPRFALNNHSNGSWTMHDYFGNTWHEGITQQSGFVGIGTRAPSGALDVTTTNPLNMGGIDLVVKDGVGANSNPIVFSHKVGSASGALTRIGFNMYSTSNGSFAVVNQTAGGWAIQSDTRNGIAAPALQFSSFTPSPVKTDVLTLTQGGNVGIGIATPSTALHVVGDITVTGNINAKYQDVAEWVPSTQKLAVGTVVIVDAGGNNHVLASTSAYDTGVAGVITGQPGLLLGEGGEGKVKVATTGRVKVRVDATRAPVRAGDLLVSSDVPGVAMRSVPVSLGGVSMHRPGTIIGKALEPLAGGTGEILVLLSLQ